MHHGKPGTEQCRIEVCISRYWMRCSQPLHAGVQVLMDQRVINRLFCKYFGVVLGVIIKPGGAEAAG